MTYSFRISLFVTTIALVSVSTTADEPNQKAKAFETPTTETADKLPDRPMSVWMQQKLSNSQAIFKSLAMGDLETIRVRAAQMNLIGKVEGFARNRNKDYQKQLHTFDRVSYEIAQQAGKGNIDGVTRAFNKLTVNCVQCHKLLRADSEKNGE